MGKIIAKGRRNGRIITVVCEDMVFTFDGEKNKPYEKLILNETKYVNPIGGTYYPEPRTMLATKIVLETSFFDKLIDLNVIGDIGVIPYEENVIY